MKRLYLIPMLAALLSMVACSRDSETISNASGFTIYPHKGAELTISGKYGKDDIYFQSTTLKFNDTCSSECTVQVLLNGMLLAKKTGVSWSYEIDPELLSRDGSSDSLSFLIARRGTSARYGFSYERYDTMYFTWNNRIRGNSTLYTDAMPLGSIFWLNLNDSSFDYSYNMIRIYEHVVWAQNVYPALGDLLFSEQDGDQMQLVVTWPDTVTFDAVDVLYDDHLLDHVTHSGWDRRYYLDDLYRDGVLQLRMLRDGKPLYINLPKLAFHTKQVSHAGSMKIN